ncbi:hypothetical protein F5141DRAFT_1061316 [Pisolithus sp. B1]|nr:hypothetical protein F5141DRAFT_1061316 [Pisolithus sp. B1]
MAAEEQVIFHVDAGFGTFLNPGTKVDVEVGKDGDDKEEITLPSFFPNFVVREEMYGEARDAFSGSSAWTGPTCAHQEKMLVEIRQASTWVALGWVLEGNTDTVAYTSILNEQA